MFGNRRIVSAVLTVSLLWGCAAPAHAVGDGVGVLCDEAYYATTDAYGNLTDGSVVKSYVLNGATSLTDRGVYDEVRSLTDDSEPEMHGGELTFRLGESQSHFYFEGKTAAPFEKLPWTISLRYALNGVPTRAEDLAGKSGLVEITVDAVPNAKATDYARNNYILTASAAFNQNDILSLEAPGAQTQLVGNLRVALFLCFPGEEGHFVLRVGTEDFSFGGMTFLLAPATLSQLDQISELSRRKEELEDNYHKLSGSLDELLDALDNVSGSLYGSARGLDALNSARATVAEGKAEVYDKGDTLRGDLNLLRDALSPVRQDVTNASALVTDMNETLRSLTAKTTVLRGDLDALKALLTEAQGSKDELLSVFERMKSLEDELNDLCLELDNAEIGRISATSQLSNSVRGYDFRDALGGLSTEYETLKALYDANGGSGMTLDGFGTAALAAGGSTATWDNVKTVYGLVAPAVDAGATPEAAAAPIAAALSKAPADVVTAYYTYLGIAAAYGSGVGSFPAFLTALAALSTDADTAAALRQLASVYTYGETVSGDLYSDARKLDQKLNREIGQVNSTIDTVNELIDPTWEVLDALGWLLNRIYALKPLVSTADSLAALGKTDAGKVKAVLDSAEALQGVLNSYEPKAQAALSDADALLGTTQDALTHIGDFSDSLEALMRRSGEQLDAAAKSSLSSLAASLRATADALGRNSGVRHAKDTITDVVEDLWDEHTGELDNLLLMDVDAPIESLTSDRNPSPQSVQVLIRTQEIEQTADKAPEEPAAQAETTTFLGRIAQMFRDFWAAITSLFR